MSANALFVVFMAAFFVAFGVGGLAGRTSEEINQRIELRARPEVIIYKDAITGDSAMVWKSDSALIHKY
jgi:hypothetical protein